MIKARCVFEGTTYHPLLGRIEKGQIIEISEEHWERVKMLFEKVDGSESKTKAGPKDEPKRVTEGVE